MNHQRKNVARILFLVAALISAPPTGAQQDGIVDVMVSPPSVPLPVGAPRTMTVVWSIQRQNNANGGCDQTITSSQGQLRVNGQVLRTIPLVLTQSQGCTGGPNAIVTISINETVTVPADVAERARRLGFSQVSYVRTFNNATTSVPEAVTLDIASSAVAALAITRQALAFENGAPATVLGRNEPLTAITELNFSGNGLLQAQWEVASPESTSGEPVFRPLSQVRQYLVGGSAEVLRSPVLPTATTGLYFVRLRISDPDPDFEPPVIRYFVLQGRRDEQPPGSTLALGAPAPRTLLGPDTVFAWSAIPGARAYQLEVYRGREEPGLRLPDLRGQIGEPTPSEIAEALSRPPVTGVLVRGATNRAVLSPMARRHLLPGRAYFWRVLALGADGRIVGASPLRELRTP